MTQKSAVDRKALARLGRAMLAVGVLVFAMSSKGEVRIPIRQPAKVAERVPSIRVDVELVMLPVTVTDQRGRIVSGLSEEHFRVFDEKELQPIVSFSGVDAPVSVGLVFDTSGSMSHKMDKARLATKAFFDTLNSDDEAFFLTFSNRPVLRRSFSSDFATLQNSLLTEKARGSTAYLDAIVTALHHLRSARYSRRALIVVSDGEDNRSRYTKGELKEIVLEADAQIYSIGIHDTYGYNAGPADRMIASRAINLMDDLSELTGGVHLMISDFNDLQDAMEKIAIALHHQYLLGYRPPKNSLKDKWRRVQVRLAPDAGIPKLRIFSRRGYYASGR